MTRLYRRWRSEEGAQLVEFALVLPLLLLVVLGIAEFGFIFQRYEVVTNAAREGARIAVLPGYGDNAVIEARVRAYLTAGAVPITAGNPVVSVTNVPIAVGGGMPAMAGRQVEVTYTHTYMFLSAIGGWFDVAYTTVPLRATSVMRMEIVAGT